MSIDQDGGAEPGPTAAGVEPIQTAPATDAGGPATDLGGLDDRANDDTDTPEVAPSEFFRKIYQFFYSKTLGVVLLLALAFYILVGAIIEQAPAGAWDDPDRRALFLEQMSAKYGGLASLFNGLGFFHLFSSVAFYVLIGLLAVSITACTVHRLPNLWRRARHPLAHATDRLFTQARYRAQVAVPDQPNDLDQVKAALQAKHYRVVTDPHNPKALYADRWAWGPFGTVAAHLSFLVIMAAFLVSSATSINSFLDLPVGGGPVALGHGSDLTIQAESFDAPTDEVGNALDYVSHLVARRGNEVVKAQDVRPNQPMSVGGFRLHQNAYGLGVQMLATGPNGEVLFDGPVDIGATPDDRYWGGGFELPGPNLQVSVFTPASGRTDSDIAPGSAVIKLTRPGSPEALEMQELAPGEALEVGDYSFTFVRETQLTIIQVRRDPGATVMWIGSILLIGGMSVTFTCRHRRYWLRLTKTPLQEGAATNQVAPQDQEDQPEVAAAAAAGADPDSAPRAKVVNPARSPKARRGENLWAGIANATGQPILQVASTDKEDLGFRRHFDNLVADLVTALSPTKGEKS